ncbi:divergent polysaccharide deacetylase family protein [Marinomonas hwangdonensis]|nr:divergent polysaccharide deacetylase family protein [Marinomonas hwangdonensis]
MLVKNVWRLLSARGINAVVATVFLLYGVNVTIAAEVEETESPWVEQLGPIIAPNLITGKTPPWHPVIAPLLEQAPIHLQDQIGPNVGDSANRTFFYAPLQDRTTPSQSLSSDVPMSAKRQVPDDSKPAKHTQIINQIPSRDTWPAKMLAVDALPEMPRIAILIDDLGYSRQGMEASLILPSEVALAILPGTPYGLKTALASQEQNRITLLHAPMENQRKLTLGHGGLYAEMSEEELKKTLEESLDSLPGVQGANNHMGSLLTENATSMKWVMEILQSRSLFFIDSLTSPHSVAKQTAQAFGLDTVSRDVFLDNIRTEQAIDRQFSRLLKLARQHGSALAIGHPYPETTRYLKKRLGRLEVEGIRLVPLSDLLLPNKE